MTLGPTQTIEPSGRPAFSLGAFAMYFLKLGALGFGGPIALVGKMERDLVAGRRWIDKQEYDEGLALAQLSPGPLAAQLAIYLGWVRGRTIGAAVVSLAFIGPSFVMVVVLSALYVRYGGLPWMRGAFYGVGATVIALIARSAVNLLRKTLKRDVLLWAIAAVNALLTIVTDSEKVAAVVLGGIVVAASRRVTPTKDARASMFALPAVLVTGVKGPANVGLLAKVLWYFTTAGAFVFGSGLAVVPFLHGCVVTENQWLTELQFLVAIAVAMITPGPVVITVAFIGYLVGGPLGAIIAAIGVFLPCFLIVVIAAPYYRRLAAKPRIKGFIDGVTAGAVVVLGRKSLVDVPTVATAALSLVAIVVVKKLPEPVLILVSAAAGIAIAGARP